MLAPQVGGRGTRRVQHRRVLKGRGDHPGSRYSCGPRRQSATGDHQRVGLGAAGGEQHLVRVNIECRCQAGARPGEHRPDAPPRGVLGGRIGPSAQAVMQVRGHLRGDLGAHGRGRGVVEVGAGDCAGAHAPTLGTAPASRA